MKTITHDEYLDAIQLGFRDAEGFLSCYKAEWIPEDGWAWIDTCDGSALNVIGAEAAMLDRLDAFMGAIKTLDPPADQPETVVLTIEQIEAILKALGTLAAHASLEVRR